MIEHAQREQLEQSRMELTMAAGAGERANRPTALVVFALLVLAIAAAYALWGLLGRQAALDRVEAQRDRAREALNLGQRLRDAAKNQQAMGLAPDPRMVGKLDAKARELGLGERLTIAESDDPTFSVPGIGQKKYIVTFNGHPSEQLLRWLDSVTGSADGGGALGGDFAGIQVARIDLRPGQPVEIKNPGDGSIQERLSGWNLNVDLVRWERKQ